ncbi:MAG: PAS domain-containing protein [Croceibacterium sp.]
MDTLRGNFDALGDERDFDAGEDDTGHEAPPAGIGTDERRMQVRAYNHWASLLEDRSFPPIDSLEPGNLPDFGPYSVLLDFTAGIENPGISYLGAELAGECGIAPNDLHNLDDVPARSLLSRITDHYMQILANQAPIGFEAEFVNQRGATILYRGILLPFSSDDETIDFIYGVINWKELADQHTSDELLLQVDQVLEQKPEVRAEDMEVAMTERNDERGSRAANDTDERGLAAAGFESDDEDFAVQPQEDSASADECGGEEETPFDYAARFNLNYDDEDEDYDEDEGEDEGENGSLPRPLFGSLTSIGGGIRKSEPRMAVLPEVPEEERGFSDMDLDDVHADFGTANFAPGPQEFSPEPDAFEPSYDQPAFAAEPVPDYAPLEATPEFAETPDETIDVSGLENLDPADMELGDWLAAAREMAAAARTSEDRTRSALYEAIGRAYDFSLAAEERPGDFEEIVADSGLTMQDRAPMTPVVKLVFGADYDKTRLTEYAAALSHAHRLRLPRGTLGEFLRRADGGLKGIVQAERQMRKVESGKAIEADPREALAARLRALPSIDFSEIDPSGAEFALVMIRRNEHGGVEIVGEVPEDGALLERAAKKLIG